MPGFGGGAFGDYDFGVFDWALRVLYETAPEVYRTKDADEGYPFRLYAEAQGVSFENLRRKIAAFADLRDPRAVRTRYDETAFIRVGTISVIKEPVQQSGVLATVSSINVFTAPRGRFTYADIGKELTISGSATETNNASVIVTNYISPTELLTNPPLYPDGGPLRWELRPIDASKVTETRITIVGGYVDDITPGWILSDGYTDFTILERRQFKPASEEWKLLTLREGSDGSINASLRFSSPTIALTSRDVGRKLTLSNTIYPGTNQGKFEIVDVLSTTECILDSTELVVEATGELVWALLRDPELVLQGTATLRGAAEQGNEDGVVASATEFTADSGAFSDDDIGKLLSIHKPGNADNGDYEVTSVASATKVGVSPSFTTAVTSDFHWELREATTIGDETQVEVRAPNLIQFLAQDFGVEIDNREEEEWQRRWVESVPRWSGIKGHEDAYKYLAELTGFTASATGLYRVNLEIYLSSVAAGGTTYKVGEAGEGRYGTDGSLNIVGSLVRFSSPTAQFWIGDIGRQIDVTGTSGSTNDGMRTIASIIDANTVEFRPSDAMTGSADGNNGSITWHVVRLYSEQVPTLPVYDEINADLMTYLKTAAVFTADKYCWEQSPSPWSTLIGPGDAAWRAAQVPPITGDGRLFITSVDPAGASAFPQSYTIVGRGDFEVAIGLGGGFWKLTDSGSIGHFLESVPTLHRDYSGSDGELTFSSPDNVFASATHTFTAAEVGKVLVTWNTADPSNSKAWLIDATYTGGALELDSSQLLTTDANNGSIEWEILDPDATGTDGQLSATRRFTSTSATFTSADEGKRIIISESGSGNNRMFVIETFVDANNVDLAPYDSPTVPDANNGSLIWAIFSYRATVVATNAPATGAATLEYICPEESDCSYCRSNKVLIEASTPYLMEKGFDRLRLRLAQVRPKHVEIIEDYGVESNASLNLTATVDAPDPP